MTTLNETRAPEMRTGALDLLAPRWLALPGLLSVLINLAAAIIHLVVML